MHTKARHFADDTIGTLKNESGMSHFQQHIDMFCAATNMLENSSKQDISPLGKLAKTTALARATPAVIDPTTNTAKTPGWIEAYHALLSLGIPIGNIGNMNVFLKDK
eukprot:1762032-Pleurochrysis_carterae.AAC.2